MTILSIVQFVAGLGLGFLYTPFPEYLLHRWPMHQEIKILKIFKRLFKYMLKAHRDIHHGRFRSGHSFVVENHPPEQQEEDREKITMAWWNGPVLVAISSIPFTPLYFIGFQSLMWGLIGGVTCYFIAYEYFHYCMHTKESKWFKSTSVYKRMLLHHDLHHLHQKTNFNVVLPIADKLFGTLITEPLRS